jgi:predicted DsbA family dithiol-disulfide isomerase
VVFFSDVACGVAYVGIHRLLAARRRLGLEGKVVIDHHSWPVEVVNNRPHPQQMFDRGGHVIGKLPEASPWNAWPAAGHPWPVSSLLALEAVQVAKRQGLDAAEELDLRLREAFFQEHRCITMRHVLLDVAASCESVDIDRLRHDLDHGTARALVFDDVHLGQAHGVRTSPHVFGGFMNVAGARFSVRPPGMHSDTMTPVVLSDDPFVYDELLLQAVSNGNARPLALLSQLT